MQEREREILKLYELMEELSDRHNADGELRSIDETTAEVALRFEIPEPERG